MIDIFALSHSRMIFRSAACTFFVAVCLSTQAFALSDEVRFHSLCDISAAAGLTDEAIIAASDEENALFSFSRTGGNAIARRDLSDLLDFPKDAKEIDIEAAARDTDRIWWLGSHQSLKPMRQMIFATNVPEPGLSDLRIVVPPFNLTGLFKDHPNAKDIWHSTTWLSDPEDGGINIEAAAIGMDGELLIGLRSPLDGPLGLEGSAIVVALEMKPRPKISNLHRLDLGGRGIRGMARLGPRLVLIAGALGDHGTSMIFEWVPDRRATALRHLDFRDFRIEALVANSSEELMVFSDDGNRLIITDEGETAKCKVVAQSSAEATPNLVNARGMLLALQ